MMGGIGDITAIPAFGVAVIVLLIVARLFAWPILKLVYNAIWGGIVLLVANYFGTFFGFAIPFNLFTALIAGFFGLPGVAVIILYSVFTK